MTVNPVMWAYGITNVLQWGHPMLIVQHKRGQAVVPDCHYLVWYVEVDSGLCTAEHEMFENCLNDAKKGT